MPGSVDVTELLEIEPSRVDAVGSPANGTKWLMLKAVGSETVETEATLDDVLAELNKADDSDGAKCPLCKGDKTIKGGNVKCPKCLGTGMAPKVGQSAKELLEEAEKASAASGAPVPVENDCPTYNGGGNIKDGTADGKTCVDCNGTGKDSAMQPDANLKTVSPPSEAVMNDGNGRTTIDKEITAYDELVKAKYKQADRDKMASSGAAMSDGAYPVADGADLDNAIHAVGRGGADHDSIRAHIIKRAKALGLSSKIPDNWGADGSMGKSGDVVEKDGMVSGPNPFLNGSVSTSTTDANAAADPGLTAQSDSDASDSAATPGSADWEACDADIATNAATALLQAAELIRQFADREAIEVAAGEGNDVFDTWDAEMALSAVTSAVGIMATLAFHEGVAAQKSESAVEKQNKRLSRKSVTALAAARDHLTSLLGDDDPAKSKDDEANKSQEDVLNMTHDELLDLLDARDARLAGKAMAADQDADNTDSIAAGKTENAKGKNRKKKVAVTDDTLEDEANQGTNASASGAGGDNTASKAELSPEEIEANEAAKSARRAAKEAKKVAKQAAENARTAKAIEEAVAKATEAVNSLQERLATAEQATEARLATVEKMAAPGGPVKTRSPEVAAKATQRDVLQFEIDRFERMAKDTPERELSAGYKERAKELRAELATLGS